MEPLNESQLLSLALCDEIDALYKEQCTADNESAARTAWVRHTKIWVGIFNPNGYAPSDKRRWS